MHRSRLDELGKALAHMAKIEVVSDGEQVPAGRDLFIEAGATGYTGLRRLLEGRHGVFFVIQTHVSRRHYFR